MHINEIQFKSSKLQRVFVYCFEKMSFAIVITRKSYIWWDIRAISIIFKLWDNCVLMMWWVIIYQKYAIGVSTLLSYSSWRNKKRLNIHNIEKNIRVKFFEHWMENKFFMRRWRAQDCNEIMKLICKNRWNSYFPGSPLIFSHGSLVV